MRQIQFVSDNDIQLLESGQALFPALLSAIESAQQDIYFETYIWACDDAGNAVQEALIRAAGGVPVFAHGLATTRGRIVGDDAIAAMTEAGAPAASSGVSTSTPSGSQARRAVSAARSLGLARQASTRAPSAARARPAARA